MHKVELTFTEKIPLSLNLFAKKKKEKEKNPKPEELINELTISPKTKSFHIRFFQDRKKILDLQLNPFTKLYHREKIPHSPIDIPCYIETHTHTHTHNLPNSKSCPVSLQNFIIMQIPSTDIHETSVETSHPSSSSNDYYEPPQSLSISPTRPGSSNGHKTVGVGTSPRPPRKSSLPSSSSFPPSEGKGGDGSPVRGGTRAVGSCDTVWLSGGQIEMALGEGGETE